MKTFYYQTRKKEWILRKYYILWISKLLYVVLPLLNRIDKIYTSYINCKMSGGSKKIHRHPGRWTKMYLGIKTFLLPVLLYCKLQFCSLVTLLQMVVKKMLQTFTELKSNVNNSDFSTLKLVSICFFSISVTNNPQVVYLFT